MGLAALGAVLHGMFARPNTVSPHEEVEAEQLVQKARPMAEDR
jgi:formate dehydrogenase iron-sulfur subunit